MGNYNCLACLFVGLCKLPMHQINAVAYCLQVKRASTLVNFTVGKCWRYVIPMSKSVGRMTRGEHLNETW